jgi:hypothetical protein
MPNRSRRHGGALASKKSRARSTRKRSPFHRLRSGLTRRTRSTHKSSIKNQRARDRLLKQGANAAISVAAKIKQSMKESAAAAARSARLLRRTNSVMGNATKSKRRTIRTKSINPFRKSGWNSMNKALRLI